MSSSQLSLICQRRNLSPFEPSSLCWFAVLDSVSPSPPSPLTDVMRHPKPARRHLSNRCSMEHTLTCVHICNRQGRNDGRQFSAGRRKRKKPLRPSSSWHHLHRSVGWNACERPGHGSPPCPASSTAPHHRRRNSGTPSACDAVSSRATSPHTVTAASNVTALSMPSHVRRVASSASAITKLRRNGTSSAPPPSLLRQSLTNL